MGANGQLGTALRELYPEAASADVDELDITNEASVMSYNWSGIDTVINAAAYTNVDGAETTEGRRAAWAVNAAAVGHLSRACSQYDMALVHISSDYVFDGMQETHTETEAFSPLGVYAQTKAAGDIAASLTPKHFILRTSWVIGDGNNFVRTMKSLAEKGIDPSVVNDQVGRITFTRDLALGIQHLLENDASTGIYNLTNEGESVSWEMIAKDVYSLCGHDPGRVSGVTTEQYYEGKSGIAPRPLQSTLDLAKISKTGFTPRNWRTALEEYLTE